MSDGLSFNRFVARVLKLCAAVSESGFDPEAHAESLAALAADLDLSDPTLVARFEALERGQAQDYLTDTVVETESGGVMLVSLLAGGGVGLHNHPHQSGFVLCCRGEVAVDTFEIASREPLQLRQRASGALGPGQTASLTPTRENLHRLHCPVATRLVDVFTPPLTESMRKNCRMFHLERETEPGLFLAESWAPNG